MSHVRCGLVATLAFLPSCLSGTAELPARAANDLACPQQQVSLQRETGYFRRAVGCGKQNVYAYLISEDRWVSPIDRAEFEFSCPRKDLTVQVLTDDTTVGVSGCEKKAVYVFIQGKWLMNTGTDERQPTPGQ